MAFPARRVAGAVFGMAMATIFDAGPVSACSCSPITPNDVLDYGLVAEGTVTSVTREPPRSCGDETRAALLQRFRKACPAGFENCAFPDGLMDEFRTCSSGGYLAEFELSTIWKGRASGTVEFRFGIDDGMCGMRLDVGDRLTILSESPIGDIWQLNKCNTWARYLSDSGTKHEPYREILEQHRDKLQTLTLATEKQPTNADAWANLGAHLASGDPAGALAAYQQAIDASPTQSIGYLGAANIYAEQSRFEDARRFLLRAAATTNDKAGIEKAILRIDFLAGHEVDPSKIDFRGFVATQSVDFNGLDLRGKDFSGAQFAEVSFRNAKLDGAKFHDVKFKRSANFENTSLVGADFSRAEFSTVFFSNVKASNATFSDTTFFFWSEISDSDLAGADFHNADFRNVGIDLMIRNSSLRGADFTWSRATSTHGNSHRGLGRITNSDITDTKFAGRVVSTNPQYGFGALDFEDADMSGASISCSLYIDPHVTNSPTAEAENFWLAQRDELHKLAAFFRDHPKVIVEDHCRQTLDLNASLPIDCRPWPDPSGKAPRCMLPD